MKFQEELNTVILDARSKDRYETKHLKGAINLPFTEFTQSNLRRKIPNTETRIIIYCSNNFKGDQKNFADKLAIVTSEVYGKKSLTRKENTVMLALNIPTYINLYGYGYRNIYELDELVDINDPRVQLDGNNGLKTIKLDKPISLKEAKNN